MRGKRYFTTKFPGGLTTSQFSRLSRADKRDVMLEWFRENYENPVNRTPYVSADGGYQFIYGGPFDAREELEGEFLDTASEKLFSEVVEELEEESDVWTHTPRPGDYGDLDEDEQEIDRDVLDQIARAVSADVIGRFGDVFETQLRAEVKSSISRLLEEIRRTRAVGIGHNNPPEAIDEALTEQDRVEIERAAVQISASLDEERPDLHLVVEKTSVLRTVLSKAYRAAGKALGWTAKKLDVAVDGFAKKLGERLADATVLSGFGYGLIQVFGDTYVKIVTWLQTVTLP
jgi:hypothetical protein